MSDNELKAVVEGLLFVSGDEGITLKQLISVLDKEAESIENVLQVLTTEYDSNDRGMIIICDHGKYSFATKPNHHKYYEKLFKTPESNKLTQASLETLAIIAYKQPITRAEIEEIRGVKSERPIQTLFSRSLIEEVGRKQAIGRPILYGTSKEFLLFFGLTSLDELPALLNDLSAEDIEKEVELFTKHLEEQD